MALKLSSEAFALFVLADHVALAGSTKSVPITLFPPLVPEFLLYGAAKSTFNHHAMSDS